MKTHGLAWLALTTIAGVCDAATLDVNTLDGGTLGSSGANPMMRSGQYVAASMTLTRTGSNPSGRASVSATEAGAIEVTVAPPSRGRGKVIIALVAVVAAIGLIFFLRRPQEPAAAASANPEPKPLASSAPAPTATETVPAVATTSAVATSEPIVPSATTAAAHNTKATSPGKTVKDGERPQLSRQPRPAPIACFRQSARGSLLRGIAQAPREIGQRPVAAQASGRVAIPGSTHQLGQRREGPSPRLGKAFQDAAGEHGR